MRRRSRVTTLLTLASGALLIGCQSLTVTPPARPVVTAQAVIPRLEGQVEFPGERQTAATTGDVISRATVSIIDAAGQTVAATVTTTAGTFTLDVNGTFTPIIGAYYTVEAIKGLQSNVSASNAVRMRTLLQWTGTAWNSCTGGATIALNPTTTAVAIIKARLSAVGFPETMGVVSGSTVTSGNATLNANWLAVRDMVTDLLWRDLDPVARIGLNGATFAVVADRAAILQPNLAEGTYASTGLMLDGSIQLTGSMPRPKTNSERSFSVAGLTSNAAVLATDGTYLYTKTWDGADTWNKTATGFGGTTQGATFSPYVNAMTSGNSAGCVGGYLYQVLAGAGNNGTLQRLHLTTGALTSVALGTPAFFRDTGTINPGGLCYLHSDGTYLYNSSYTINNGGTNGYTVRVYDPASAFALVRQIYMDGSNTPLAGTSYYTDGMVFDGVYAYALEWLGLTGGIARIRRYRLADGQLEIETTFPQSLNIDDPITGSYDKVNNKFWFGDYRVGTIHRTEGRVFASTGTWTSSPMDSGSATPLYGRLNFNSVAVNGQGVRFQVRSADDQQALSTATWYGPTGVGDYYTTSGSAANPVHNRNRWIQIQATLTPDKTAMLANSGPLAAGGTGPSPAANTTPRLYAVTLESTP